MKTLMKSHGITKATMIHPLCTIDILTTFQENISNIYRDISVWWTDNATPRAMPLAWVKNYLIGLKISCLI